MALFDLAYRITAQIEGGYSNHPNDHGGETYCGISRKTFGSWEGWKIIDQIDKAVVNPSPIIKQEGGIPLQLLVKEFYLRNFWKPIQGDSINSQEIANEIYDTAVNFGVPRAINIAQVGANLLNKNGKLFYDLLIDGFMGSKTIEIINNHLPVIPFVRVLNGLQFARYVDICKHDTSQEVFFLGWINRT